MNSIYGISTKNILTTIINVLEQINNSIKKTHYLYET